jgi:alpha-beta hydrolase superfamily lysophospholipase
MSTTSAAATAVEPTVTPAWLTGPSSTSFYTVTYAPASSAPKGVLLFIHGFVEHVGRYDHVFRAWTARGFGVFTYDQRGFGRTALDEKHKSKDSKYGKTNMDAQLEDVRWAVEEAKKKWPDVPMFLMGHSMVSPLRSRIVRTGSNYKRGRRHCLIILHTDEEYTLHRGACL